MRSPEADPQKVLRHALARAAIVEGYDHICRRCKAAEKAGHTTRHPDAALRYCDDCGMKLWPKALPRPMRFHDLRHTTATLLLRAGVDAHRVQRILRHSDVRTTTGTYGHLDVEDLRKAMGLLAPLPEKQTSAARADEQLAASDAQNITPFATRLLPGSLVRRKEGREPFGFTKELAAFRWSGRQDSNLRPPGPELYNGPSDRVARRVIGSHPIETTQVADPANTLNPRPDRPCRAGFSPLVAPRSTRLSLVPEALFTVSEAAKLLNISRATAYKLCERGELPHIRISNAIRIAKADLEAFRRKGSA